MIPAHTSRAVCAPAGRGRALPVELDPAVHVPVASTDADDPIEVLFVDEMVSQVLREVEATGDESMVVVARAWLLAPEVGEATNVELVRVTGLPVKTVRSAKTSIKDIFRGVLTTHYGVAPGA